MKHILPLIIILFGLSACASVERLAIPQNTLNDQLFAQVGEVDAVDHAPFDQFLKTYTTMDHQGIVRVNYGAVTPKDTEVLENYIIAMGRIDPSTLTRDAQLAFWSNLYNAVTLKTILNHYPVHSIRDIKNGVLDLGPWDEKRVIVNGKALSLHNIEHGIVRALWADEPNVHYLLNCAAAGCPNLSQVALTADNVQKIMTTAAYDYVNNPRGVIVNDDGRVGVSKIYSWYLNDFGGSQVAILDHIRTYATGDLKNNLQGKNTIHHYYYDWMLNDSIRSNTVTPPQFPKQGDLN